MLSGIEQQRCSSVCEDGARSHFVVPKGTIRFLMTVVPLCLIVFNTASAFFY